MCYVFHKDLWCFHGLHDREHDITRFSIRCVEESFCRYTYIIFAYKNRRIKMMNFVDQSILWSLEIEYFVFLSRVNQISTFILSASLIPRNFEIAIVHWKLHEPLGILVFNSFCTENTYSVPRRRGVEGCFVHQNAE
jgi:hypothetical protein